MIDSKFIMFFLGSLGAFNGLILGLWLLLFARVKTVSNTFLGALLLALSIRVGKSVLVTFNPTIPKVYVQIGLSACLLIGPFLYFYVRSTVRNMSDVPRPWKWQIGFLLGLILVGALFCPYAIYPDLWNRYIIKGIYGIWVLYVIAAVIAAGPLLARLFSRKTVAGMRLLTPEKWMLTIMIANLVIFSTFALAMVMPRQCSLYFSSSVLFTFFLYGIIIVLALRSSQQRKTEQATPVKYANKKVDDDAAAGLLGRLEQVMQQQEIYKDPALSLAGLAKVVQVTPHQLSQVLNDNLGKNFTAYINGYRVNKACAMIASNHPYSLEAIGYEVGFNSKSTFYAAFRKIMDTTPALYKEGLTKADTI